MIKFVSKWIVMVAAVFLITIFAAFSITHAKEKRATDTVGSAAAADPLVVQTQYGQVRGVLNDGVRTFHGVPYAEDPSGDRRWLPPTEPKPWSGSFDATKPRPGCPQDCTVPLFCTDQISENCLFLEIYAPLPTEHLVEVLVYLHGGGFKDVTSTVRIFDSTNLVKKSGLITVLVEYRIGVLGFLYTGTGEGDVKGNCGLLDQRQALVWVKQNIRAFGGDPNKVTLAGQSAGAQSVILHLVSGQSSDLFRSAIIESPPLSLRYQTPETAIKHAQTVSEILGCLVENSTTMNMTCMREKPVAKMLEAQNKAVENDFELLEKLEPWGPVIDGKVVTGQTLTELRTYANSDQPKKPIIWGHTAEEAILYVYNILTSPVPEFMYRLILGIVLASIPENLTTLYPVTNASDIRNDLSVLFTDIIFVCPIRQAAQLLAHAPQNSKVWIYKWAKPLKVKLPHYFSFCEGKSCHGTPIPFFFQSFQQMLGEAPDEDIKMSNALIDYITNFIKFGDPNGENKFGEQNNTVTKLGANSSLEASLTYWPTVNGGQVNSTTQLLFTEDGQLEVTRQSTNPRCEAWDSTNYSLG